MGSVEPPHLPPSPPCGLPLLPFQSPKLEFQRWEGLGIKNVPKEIFWSSSSIGQPHRDPEPGVLTGTESPDPRLPWLLSAATKRKDLDAQLCNCGLISAQPCRGSIVAIVHGAHGLTQLERHVLRPTYSMSELRGLQDLICPSASFCR